MSQIKTNLANIIRNPIIDDNDSLTVYLWQEQNENNERNNNTTAHFYLWHPLHTQHYNNPQIFHNNFDHAYTQAKTLGYHQFDAMVIASYYAAKQENDQNQKPTPFPKITASPILKTTHTQACANIHNIGLYPVFDDIQWINRLAPLGIRTMQLRIKNLEGKKLEQTIKEAINLAKQQQISLFINDHWQIAIKHQAYGIHLGQEDTSTANIAEIKKHGLRLGISTHSHYEMAYASAFQPSYLAAGPIFATNSKPMAFEPQGLDYLSYWRQMIQKPLVAIGGINHNNIHDVWQKLNHQSDGIALISAITQAKNPEQATKDLMQIMGQTQN